MTFDFHKANPRWANLWNNGVSKVITIFLFTYANFLLMNKLMNLLIIGACFNYKNTGTIL